MLHQSRHCTAPPLNRVKTSLAEGLQLVGEATGAIVFEPSTITRSYDDEWHVVVLESDELERLRAGVRPQASNVVS